MVSSLFFKYINHHVLPQSLCRYLPLYLEYSGHRNLHALCFHLFQISSQCILVPFLDRSSLYPEALMPHLALFFSMVHTVPPDRAYIYFPCWISVRHHSDIPSGTRHSFPKLWTVVSAHRSCVKNLLHCPWLKEVGSLKVLFLPRGNHIRYMVSVMAITAAGCLCSFLLQLILSFAFPSTQTCFDPSDMSWSLINLLYINLHFRVSFPGNIS